jgi:serine/threonine-protein kinase
LYEAPRPLTERVPEISEELSSLVLSMLAKKPADRPSMEQVVKGLEQLGAPKATDSMPIVRRPSRDGDRMAIDGVDPFASTIGQIAVRTQRWLNNVAQRRAVIATGVVVAAMTPLALLLHMHREPPRIDGSASPQSSRVNDVKAAVSPLPVPPLPAAPRDIRLSLQTDPPGAEVLRVADGVLLGRTPWTMSRPADQGRLPVLLRLPGHQELRVDLDLAQDSERVEVLRPVPPSASKRDHRSKSARKRGNQPSEPAAVEPDTGPDVVEPIPRIVE